MAGRLELGDIYVPSSSNHSMNGALLSSLSVYRHSVPHGNVCRTLLSIRDVSPTSHVFNQNKNSPWR